MAKKLGLQVPINEKLVKILQEMAANHEPPGKYTPVPLSEILELNNSERWWGTIAYVEYIMWTADVVGGTVR